MFDLSDHSNSVLRMFSACPRKWLESKTGRKMMADSIRVTRRLHPEELRQFCDRLAIVRATA